MFEFTHIHDAAPFLIEKLSSRAFLDSACSLTQSSSFIAPYGPEQEQEAQELIEKLIDELAARGVAAQMANLYDLMLDAILEHGLWESIIEAEPTMSKPEFTEALRGVVDLEGTIIPNLRKQVQNTDVDVLLITGVGTVYPVIRAHRVLESLKGDIPVVLFFPGRYSKLPDGSTSLDVLATPAGKGGAQYRARNVFDL